MPSTQPDSRDHGDGGCYETRDQRHRDCVSRDWTGANDPNKDARLAWTRRIERAGGQVANPSGPQGEEQDPRDQNTRCNCNYDQVAMRHLSEQGHLSALRTIVGW